MSATVRQRGDKWEYRYDAGRDPITGRRLRPGRSGFTTREAAEAALREAERARRDVTQRRDSGGEAALTVLAYLTQWLTDIAGTIRSSTWTSYSTYVASYIAPAIGALPLLDLTAGHLNRLYGHLLNDGRARGEGGLAPKTVVNLHRMLHRALSPAVTDGLLPREVLEGAIPPPASEQEPSTWNAERIERFLDHIRADRHRALWLLLMSTGLDRHDLVSLRRDHIDLQAACITRHCEQHHLDDHTTDALREHLDRSVEERNLLGLSTHLVFIHPDGRPVNPYRVTVWFHNLCDDAGLPRIRVQELRLAYAEVVHDTAAETSEDADREAAKDVAALILHGSNGRESGRHLVHNGSTEDEGPSDQSSFRRSEGTSTCSGGRI